MTSAFRAAAAAAALAGLAACAPTQPGLPHDGTGFEGGVPFGTYTIVGFGQEAVPTRDGHVRLTPGQITGQGRATASPRSTPCRCRRSTSRR